MSKLIEIIIINIIIVNCESQNEHIIDERHNGQLKWIESSFTARGADKKVPTPLGVMDKSSFIIV